MYCKSRWIRVLQLHYHISTCWPQSITSRRTGTKLYFSYAPTDAVGRPVCDQCNPEYEGPNCVQCRDGYHNSDSICIKCDCNGNADPRSKPRICDPDTGHCLNCSYNTTGRHCQVCGPGFTGNALARNCTAIGKPSRVQKKVTRQCYLILSNNHWGKKKNKCPRYKC